MKTPYSPLPRFHWPNGKRCAVMLCFDVDGETVALSEDRAYAARRTFMSQCEYGPRVGVPRILELLGHYEIPATFFVPAYVARLHPKMVAAITSAGHELGAHGDMHEKLASLDRQKEEEILDRCLDDLERLGGARPRGFRAPWFETNPWTADVLKSRGLFYSASEMGDDVPYSHSNGLVEIPGQWFLEDWEQFAFHADPMIGFQPADNKKVFRIWWDEFFAMREMSCCFVLTMHPFLIGRPSRIRLLERILRGIMDCGDAWIARGSEIAEYVLENPDARREVDLDG